MKSHVSLFGIPIRFDLTFFFLVVMFGYFRYLRGPADPDGMTLFIVWIPLMTAAILLHELGHAITGRLFGLAPFIVLHGMGGLTQFDARAHRELSHGRRILITLAGPLVGFVVGGIASVATLIVPLAEGSLAAEIVDALLLTTIGWGLLNLVPMLPLDGGHIVATALEKLFGIRGIAIARIASIVLAVGLGAAVAWQGAWFLVLILGALAYSNYRAYQIEGRWREDEPLEQAMRESLASLEAGDTVRAKALAEAIRERARTPKTKARVAHVLAWAHLVEGDPGRARRALEGFPSGHRPDAFLEGSVLLASDRPSDAIVPLVEALVDRGEPQVAEALADAAGRAGRIDELVGLLESREREVEKAALQLVAHRLFTSDHVELAGDLYEKLFARFSDAIDAFNAGCARARTGRRDRALRLLDDAVRAGLDDPTVLDRDEDLAALRGTEEMDALRRRAGLVPDSPG